MSMVRLSFTTDRPQKVQRRYRRHGYWYHVVKDLVGLSLVGFLIGLIYVILAALAN